MCGLPEYKCTVDLTPIVVAFGGVALWLITWGLRLGHRCTDAEKVCAEAKKESEQSGAEIKKVEARVAELENLLFKKPGEVVNPAALAAQINALHPETAPKPQG